MILLDIAEVSKRSGLPAATLRFYEEKGLIESLGRRGLRRTFDPGVIERLALIALGRMAGFSLDDIAGIFGGGARPEIDRSLLMVRAEEVGRKIQQLEALKRGLEHAAVCPARDHLECPSFQRLTNIAGARMTRARSRRRAPRR
ncbi:helix-turn-helix domain-containing protein [Sphingomonas sp. Root710]|uniref:helix-turn-helix domain-containing protein n=1 Tax=Sphingomonas sp. Root710 TaxID=1736594 RepID=UPI0012E3A96E|nr:helix-turn-helix domain-containing protein [Sphingomonas sp. Root710]